MPEKEIWLVKLPLVSNEYASGIIIMRARCIIEGGKIRGGRSNARLGGGKN